MSRSTIASTLEPPSVELNDRRAEAEVKEPILKTPGVVSLFPERRKSQFFSIVKTSATPGHIPISDCEICSKLSSHNYVDLRDNFAIPDHIAVLTGTSVTARPAQDIIECPVCGSFYSYTYTCGFTENDIELRRITPVEAGHETDVEAYVSDLSNSHEETRAYAAQCLVEYYLSKGLEREAGYLLSHEDEIIRSYAEASRRYYLYHQSLKT